MKFYCISINNVLGCVVNDQMTDQDIQAAIKQELDCMGLKNDEIYIDHFVPGVPLVKGIEHDYNTTPITVHQPAPPRLFLLKDWSGSAVAVATIESLKEAVLSRIDDEVTSIGEIVDSDTPMDVRVSYNDEDGNEWDTWFSYEPIPHYY